MVVPLIAAGARVAGRSALKASSRGVTAASQSSAKTLPQATAPSRGVQNTQRFSTERPTVRSDFRESKSLQAKVARSLEARGKEKGGAPNFIQSRETRNPPEGRAQGTTKDFIDRLSGTAERAQNIANVASSATFLYWLSSVLSFLIFIFGIASLVFIIMGDAGLLGISLDDVLNVISYILTLGFGSFTLKELGLACWVLTIIFVMIGYLIIALFAMLRLNIKFLDHRTLFVLTAFTLGASILPVLQLFPWMVLWVAAIQAEALRPSTKR